MDFRTTKAVHAYWADRASGGAVPSRHAINPADLSEHLPLLFIAAFNETDTPHFRLAGTSICQIFGRELRNAPFAVLFEEESVEMALAIARTVRERSLPARLDLAVSDGDGESPAEMVLLPLADPDTGSDRMLGSLARPADPIRHDGSVRLRLLDCEFIDHSGRTMIGGRIMPERRHLADPLPATRNGGLLTWLAGLLAGK